MRIPQVHNQNNQDYTGASKNVEKCRIVQVDISAQEYIDDIGLFEDPKEFAVWVKRMKYTIRHSFEYVELVSFLKHFRGMDCCGVHPNISIKNGFTLEMHHTPFTITDIITIVTKKRMDRNESLKMTEIAQEVMELHYLGVVGLYTLCPLCHQYGAHAEEDELFIPLDKVFWEPEQFVDIYKQYMTESMMTKWENILLLNKGYTLIRETLPISLQREYIYVEAKDETGKVGEHISTTKLINFMNELGTDQTGT